MNDIFNKLNNGIQVSENFCFVSRSSSQQIEQCFELDSLQHSASEAKQKSAYNEKERNANMFLGFECVIGAVKCELMMWVLLKRDKPNQAWDRLVSAQMGYMDASRAHEGFKNCDHGLKKLELIEKYIFPPQVFMSAGIVSKRIDCSICGKAYSQCDHLRGKPYMGEFCEVIYHDFKVDHSAIVEHPADKRCRVTSFKTDSGYRDKLSWDITPYDQGENFNPDDPLEVKSVFMSFDRFPYLTSTKEILGH